MRTSLCLALFFALALVGRVSAQEAPAIEPGLFQPEPIVMANYSGRNLPEPGGRYINDFAGLFDPVVRLDLHRKLMALEEDTSQRITIMTYPGLARFGWSDTPSARANFVDTLYSAWEIAGEDPEQPGHLLAIGRNPRHVLYEVGTGFRYAWVRELQRIFLEDMPNPLERANFSQEMVRLIDQSLYDVEDNTGTDWTTIGATVGLAGLAFFGFTFIQRLKDESPPPPVEKTKELARPRVVGAPVREVTANDLFVPMGFDAKKAKKKPPPDESSS